MSPETSSKQLISARLLLVGGFLCAILVGGNSPQVHASPRVPTVALSLDGGLSPAATLPGRLEGRPPAAVFGRLWKLTEAVVDWLKQAWAELFPPPKPKPESKPAPTQDPDQRAPGGDAPQDPDRADPEPPSVKWNEVGDEIKDQAAQNVAKEGPKHVQRGNRDDGSPGDRTPQRKPSALQQDAPDYRLFGEIFRRLEEGYHDVHAPERLGPHGDAWTVRQGIYLRWMERFEERLAECTALTSPLEPGPPGSFPAGQTPASNCFLGAAQEQHWLMAASAARERFPVAEAMVRVAHNRTSHHVTLYCGCTYHAEGVSTGHTVPNGCAGQVAGASGPPDESPFVEWTRVVPAAWMGAARPCWTEGHGLCGAADIPPGEACCLTPGVDDAFVAAFSDPHNVFPASRRIHGERGDLPFEDVAAKPPPYTDCGIRTAGFPQTFQVPPSARGEVARAALYMMDRYGVDVGLNRSRLLSWANEDPAERWELARAEEIERLSGMVNPYVFFLPPFNTYVGTGLPP